MSVKFVTVPSKLLGKNITGTDSTFQVNNILGWDGVALTSASFGSQGWCVFRNAENTAMEIMEFDPTTIASTNISILKRGLKFDGDLTTQVTANKLTWIKQDTIIEFGTDVPQLLSFIAQVANLQLTGNEWDFGAHTAEFTETNNGNSSTAQTVDWRLSNKQKTVLTGNCTFTFTAPTKPASLLLKLVQDGTGSRTVTWPATVHWSGGTAPTLTTTLNKVDIITFYFDGTTYFGASTLNYTA